MPEILRQFWAEIARARKAGDPNAGFATLATTRADAAPGIRTVVLRDIGGRPGLFTSATSPKWAQISADNRISLAIWLPTLQVQYVIEGRAEPIPNVIVSNSWQQRPRPAQILDHYYATIRPQSSPLDDRSAFLDGARGLRRTLGEAAPLDPPESAAGCYVNPECIERLALDDTERLHDRVRHRLEDDWRPESLVP